LHTGDGWQSGDGSDDRRLHTGDGWQSGDADCKHLTNSDHLQDHVRIETCDKPYKCGICGKEYSENGSLQKHIRTHAGDKPYKCNICKKEFSAKQPLMPHKAVKLALWVQTSPVHKIKVEGLN
jgi:KRAB domain-containing zinc finger protein